MTSDLPKPDDHWQENEVDMLRHEVEELREENDGFSAQMDRLRSSLSQAKV